MTSASTVGLPEDKAYIAHHFNCPTCCAAGRSGGKQARCADGQQLWDDYNQAVHLFSLQKQKALQRGPTIHTHYDRIYRKLCPARLEKPSGHFDERRPNAVRTARLTPHSSSAFAPAGNPP